MRDLMDNDAWNRYMQEERETALASQPTANAVTCAPDLPMSA